MLVAAIAIAVPMVQGKWELKLDTTPKSSVSYAVVINANQGGENHEAEFRMVRDILSSSEKGIKAKLTWADLVIDEHSAGEDSVFETTLDNRGLLSACTSTHGDNARRMLSVFAFPYPESADIAQKWTCESKIGGAAKQKFSVENLGLETIGDRKVYKFSVKMEESGDNGIKSEGTFWIEPTGKIVKFTIHAKNWVLPMAGADLVEADIRGDLIPGK